MKITLLVALISTVIGIGLSTEVNAAIVSADFRTEADLPSMSSGAPLIYESLNSNLTDGYELDASDFLSNPMNWSGGRVYIDLNPNTHVLRLDSQDNWDFETFVVKISNIQFNAPEVITHVELFSDQLTDHPSLIPTISWTENSITISYSAMELDPSDFNFTGQSATYQIYTSAAIPEPSTFGFVLGGSLLTLGWYRRRNVKV